MSQSIPGKPVFPALPRHSSRGSTDTTVARGTAMWESLVGKPRGKATGTRSGGLRKGQSPCELLGGLSGFLSLRCRGLRTCVEPVPEPGDSSPEVTWIWGVLLESPQWNQSSSGVGACTCSFLPFCSNSVTLPFVWIKGSGAFPRGFSRRLSHEAFPQGCPTCHRCVSRSSA